MAKSVNPDPMTLLLKTLPRVPFNALFMWLYLIVPVGAMGGYWNWTRGWQYIYFMTALTVVATVALAFLAPKGLAARMTPPYSATQPLADKHASILLFTAITLQLILVPWDVHYTQILGVTCYSEALIYAAIGLAGYILICSVIVFNEFSITYVDDQRSSGQKLVENGPYGLVRHPMYLGMALMMPGMAGWLGSRFGAVVCGIFTLLVLIPRIQAEEAMLVRTLKGYKGYMARRPWRVIPFVY